MSKREHNSPPSALKITAGTKKVVPPSDFVTQKIKYAKSNSGQTEYYCKGILEANRTILSKAITLIESSLADHQKIARKVIAFCLRNPGNAIRIGITGAPGVGKSSFIETFGKYLTSKGHKVAVLAIDPSSIKSKGSILGDKTRMEQLSSDPNAFIRPSPSSGTLGGVAQKTRETMMLCETAGFDIIIIETVGVGQSEVIVRSMVDFFLLLLMPGAGDELQGIKRGIMEMADGIVINKADGDNLRKVPATLAEIKNAISYMRPHESAWIPKVESSSSLAKTGIEKVWAMIGEFIEFTEKSGYLEQQRHDQLLNVMYQSIENELIRHFYSDEAMITYFALIRKKLQKGLISPYTAAQKMLDKYYGSKS
jgi:LAO/AO transport system kinase